MKESRIHMRIPLDDCSVAYSSDETYVHIEDNMQILNDMRVAAVRQGIEHDTINSLRRKLMNLHKNRQILKEDEMVYHMAHTDFMHKLQQGKIK